jgi:PAS domain S-box-containing protein
MSEDGGYIGEKQILVSEMDFLISRTDKEGVITYVSDDFCKVCGYKREELIGFAHNIIRHPDVPKAAFKEMWELIEKGKKWSGVVKNRAKSGAFYWVFAEVSPFVKDGRSIGYKSVRKKASEQQILTAIKVYKDLNDIEAGIEEKWVLSEEDTTKIEELGKKYNIENNKLVGQMIKLMEKRLEQAKHKSDK